MCELSIAPRSGPPQPTALGTGRFRCYTANRVGSFVGHVPLLRGIPPPAGGFPLSPPGTGGTGPGPAVRVRCSFPWRAASNGLKRWLLELAS